MGAADSKYIAPLDIATDIVTNISTTVITNNSNIVSDSNKLVARCDGDVYNTAVKSCEDATNARLRLAEVAMKAGQIDYANKLVDQQAPVCDTLDAMCSISNVSQTVTRSIELNNETSNDIANEVINEINLKLQDYIDQTTKAGLSGATSDIDAAKNVHSAINSDVATDIITNTLNSFSASNELEFINMSVDNVQQNITSSAIANNIVNNLVENNTGLQADLEQILTAKQETTGTELGDILGLIAGIGAIILGFVLVVVFIKILISRKGRSSSASRSRPPRRPQYDEYETSNRHGPPSRNPYDEPEYRYRSRRR